MRPAGLALILVLAVIFGTGCSVLDSGRISTEVTMLETAGFVPVDARAADGRRRFPNLPANRITPVDGPEETIFAYYDTTTGRILLGGREALADYRAAVVRLRSNRAATMASQTAAKGRVP
ncbi:MAG: hypothetical protein Fur0032_08740 [Terrimicrobiaceae bacterium]